MSSHTTSHASKSSTKQDATAAAQSKRAFFDPWNSSSTGHQRAENRLSGSTSWRDSRSIKLTSQYNAGQSAGGGERLYDTVGAGSENFGKDGRKENGGWVKGASGLRGKCQRSILEVMGVKNVKPNVAAPATKIISISPPAIDQYNDALSDIELDGPATPIESQQDHKKQIFQNLCVYINGSTAPLISDHKLKYILAEHGAKMSIALGRRSVTHVILGTGAGQGGAGGGLSGSKIQKEIARVGGKGVKFVGPEW